MTFINPIEILNLSGTPLQAIDNVVKKKARKAVLAEIDLSDDELFHYHQQQLTKADCERSIDELEQQDRLEFYHFIAGYEPLNQFLTTGNTALFTAFKHESIFTLPEFIRFISPYFAAAYSRVLQQAYTHTSSATFLQVIAVPPIVTEEDKTVAYQSIRTQLNQHIELIHAITLHVKAADETADMEAIARKVEGLVVVEKINALPDYFQPLINTLFMTVRELFIATINVRKNLKICIQLYKHITDVKADLRHKERVWKDLADLTRVAVTDPRFTDTTDEDFRHYRNLFPQLEAVIHSIEHPQTSLAGIGKWVEVNINTTAINTLPSCYNGIKNHLVLRVKELAILTWNRFFRGDEALQILAVASTINYQDEYARQQLAEGKESLNREIRNQRNVEKVNLQNQQISERTTSNADVGKVIQFFVAIIFAIFFFAVCTRR